MTTLEKIKKIRKLDASGYEEVVDFIDEKRLEKTMTIRKLEVPGYEDVVEFVDEKRGLHAIVAIHNTSRGPALGGTRVFAYPTFDQALEDVLRLAKGMTYKAAISNTKTGGGKSVIIYDNKKAKPKELLQAFAEVVNYFKGRYICAEDVGMSLEDMGVIGHYTPYAVGLPHPDSSQDPSPFTAYGVFKGIEATVQHLWKSSVEGKVFAIQGLGSVGMSLASRLFWHGAELIVADLDQARCEKAAKEFGATIVSPEKILEVSCDVLVPCAMGGILNAISIPKLKCRAIAGASNNQLLTAEDGQRLKVRGIIYAPDYLINSGGLINVCTEIEKNGYCPKRARKQIAKIYDVISAIYQRAERSNLSSDVVANQIAEENLAKGQKSEEKPYLRSWVNA